MTTESCFKTYNLILRLLQFWGLDCMDNISKKRKLLNLFLGLGFIGIYPIFEVIHFIKAYKSGSNLFELVEIASAMFEIITISYRCIYFIINKNEIFVLKTKIQEFSLEQCTDSEIRRCDCKVYVHFVTSLLVGFMPILMIAIKLTTANSINNRLAYDLWVPFDYLDDPINFVIVCIFEMFIGIYFLSLAMICDFLYLSLMVTFKGSCLDSIADVNIVNCEIIDDLKTKFDKIIKMREINVKMNNLVSYNFLIQIFLRSSILCATVYCLVHVSM